MSTVSTDLLTTAEVAATFRVDRGTVARWHREGTLAGLKIGGTLRFRRSDVEALLAPDTTAEASS